VQGFPPVRSTGFVILEVASRAEAGAVEPGRVRIHPNPDA
jgi:hypothetical protein